MILNTIWKRYIFKDLIKCFLFFLICFFVLYSLADFSTHPQDFILQGKIDFKKLFAFYAHQFLKRFELLFPLSFLIASIKVLSSLNSNKELVAFQVAGLRIKKILSPLWLLAILCCLMGFLNQEFFLPKSISYLDQTNQTRTKNSAKKTKKKPFTTLDLNDSSRLIYQSFDPQKNVFFDVYWIRSFDDIWKIKYLSADPQRPLGEFVDHILRNKEGFLEKKESYEQCLLPSLKWKIRQLNPKQSSIKHQPISRLAKLLFTKEIDSFRTKGEITTHFTYKLLAPLLPFLILIGIAPFCITYSRNSPLFLVYGISIFSFVVFFTLIHSMIIIGENQTLPPFIAIGTPFLLAFIGCQFKYRLLK